MEFRDIIPGRVTYAERFLPEEEEAELLAEVIATSEWSQERLKVRGLSVPFPRLVAWYGDEGVGYRYSGIEHPARPWTAPLLRARDRIASALDVPYNGVLLNRYRDGRDSIGRHGDREEDLVPGSPICGLSLGSSREIRFRPRGGTAAEETRLTLTGGSLLVMYGDCQAALTHEIRKVTGPVGERVSLTFRMVSPAIKTAYEEE